VAQLLQRQDPAIAVGLAATLHAHVVLDFCSTNVQTFLLVGGGFDAAKQSPLGVPWSVTFLDLTIPSSRSNSVKE
jgi:hypothetical protein